MTITPEEMARLAEAATPGPWEVADDGEDVWSGDDVVCGWAGIDAPFIAAAHDMAALIAEQDRLLKLADAFMLGMDLAWLPHERSQQINAYRAARGQV